MACVESWENLGLGSAGTAKAGESRAGWGEGRAGILP